MVFSHFDAVRRLKDSGGYDWLIKVRVLSIWRAINIKNGEIRGINILVIDDSNTRVVCFAGKQDYLAMEKTLYCGRIYRISNFSVKKYHDDPYPRPVCNDCRIFFSNYTHFEEDLGNETLIPYLGFDLQHLSDVEKLSSQSLYLSDVVGVVEVVKPSYSFMNKNKISQSFVPFFISNGSLSAKVIFWDQFGDMLLEEMEKVKVKPAIISIMCCKAQNRIGDIYFSSNPATKFYLNCDHYSVRLLRKKIDDGLVNVTSTAEVGNVQPEVHKMKDLASVPSNLREATVHGSFISIRNDQLWFEHVCTTCHKGVTPEGRRFRCTHCDRHVPFPDKRFRLECMAADETGQVKVLLLDREVRKIISKSVFEVEVELSLDTDFQKLNSNVIPTALNCILQKTFSMTLILPVIVDPLEERVCTCLSLQDVAVPLVSMSPNITTATARNIVEKADCSPISSACSTPVTGHSSSKERDILPIRESAASPQFYSYTNDQHIKLINLLSLNALRVSEMKPQMLLKCFGQIVRVDGTHKWFKDTCVVCGMEATKRFSELYCCTCSRAVFYPLRRCSLRVEVYDIVTCSTFTLSHDVLCRLSPKQMEIFVDRKNCITSAVPKCFLNFVGLKCLFVLEMGSELFRGGVVVGIVWMWTLLVVVQRLCKSLCMDMI